MTDPEDATCDRQLTRLDRRSNLPHDLSHNGQLEAVVIGTKSRAATEMTMQPNTAQAITQQELEVSDGTPGITRKVAFKSDTNALVQVHVDGGVSSGWHHHCDRHVFAHLIEGSAVIEYGPGGTEHLDVEAGGFFHLPPRTVHRDGNPVDEAQLWIISFVGPGPLVENVDGPEPK